MAGSTPPRVAPQRTDITVGTATGAAGCCTLVVVVAALANQSVLPAAALAAAGGAALGLAGSQRLRIETIWWVLNSERRTMLSWVPLAAALVVTLALGVDGFTSGNDRVFWVGLGALD